MKCLNTDKKCDMVRGLKRDGRLSHFVFLMTIKQHQKKSAFITTNQIMECRDYTKQTIKKYLKRLEDIGWATRHGDDWYLISWRKIANEYTKHRRIVRLSGETTKELLARIGALYIERNLIAQVKTIYPNRKHDKLGDIIQCFDKRVSFSVRKIMDLLGYESPQSGTNIMEEMERLGLIQRRRRFSYVCNLEQASPEIFSIISGSFVKGRYILKRETSMVRMMR